MNRTNKIAVIGSGAFGMAIAHAASFNTFNKVVMYSRDERVAQHIREKKRNPDVFQDIELNGNISASSDFKEVITNATIILSCIPTQQ